MSRKRAVQVFVSHTGADAPLAHRLAGDLTSAGLASWIAPESIRPGEGWVDAINRGLEESRVVVVLLTPRAVDSMWVRQEVSAAIALERKGRIRVIPLAVEPCDVPPLWDAYQQIPLTADYAAGVRALCAAITGTPGRRSTGPSQAPRAGARRQAELAEPPAELSSYARLYDALYPRLPGELRNYVLNTVFVDQIFRLGSGTKFETQTIERLYHRGSDGDRMVALLVLETAPSAACLDIAVDALERPRSPFEQYHGLRAIDLMAHLLSQAERLTVSRALDGARRRYLVPANQSRWEVYQDIVKKLADLKAARTRRRAT